MFAVTSSRLVCSALRLLSTLAESPVMFRAFPLLSATARAIIPRAARHASTRTRTLFVTSWFSYSLHLRQWMVARGLAKSAKRLQRRSEDGREITAHHRLVVREREGVVRLSGAAFEIACATIVRLVLRRVGVADRQ
jgi:hypothetical protein